MRTIASFFQEGYATVFREDGGRVFGLADFDIDADGANSQFGKRAAYMVGNLGSEDLANGGMKFENSRVLGKEPWFKDIVILGHDGQPAVFFDRVIASKTAYHFQGVALDDPKAYVDSETIPYIVVQKDIITKTNGAVLGCRARCTMVHSGVAVDCIVADVGPRSKIGEGSIELARRLGIPSSPRSGGIDYPGVLFELWPGVHGEINGEKIPMLNSSGIYIPVS